MILTMLLEIFHEIMLGAEFSCEHRRRNASFPSSCLAVLIVVLFDHKFRLLNLFNYNQY